MENEIKFHQVDVIKDLDQIIYLTKQSAKLERFVKAEDLDEYATYFALRSFLSASFCLGAYLDDKLIGFITCSFRDKDKIYIDSNIVGLNLNLKNKFSRYHFLADTAIYGDTCQKLLEEEDVDTDGEITLFVVDKEYRRLSIGKKLMLSALDYYQKNKAWIIYLTSDTECNYMYYLNYDFKIKQRGVVSYPDKDVGIFIEYKTF